MGSTIKTHHIFFLFRSNTLKKFIMKSSLLIVIISVFIPIVPLLAQTDNNKREGNMADPAINPIYNYYEWANEIPEDCPFERSEDIKKVVFTGRYANYTGADTWYLQSAPDGNMYSPWTDGNMDGFSVNSNIRSQSTGQAKIIGTDPVNLKFKNLGRMWSGGSNYYPCVSLIVDSAFYIGTYYAYNNQGYFNGFRYSSNWDNFTANTEPDWENSYWTNAIDPDGNFFNEKGKAKFRTPHAVNFARNNKANDGMVYLSAHGYSSGAGMNDWDKGDAIYLCRVNSTCTDIINPDAYSFFCGHDEKGKAIWGEGVENAKPILDWPNHLGSESITWFPELKKYILMSCRLKENENNLPYNVTSFWEADQITGPYKIVHYMRNWGQQAYFPNIPSQMINNDGKSAWMTVSCNYSVQNIDPHQCRYAASMHEIVFDVEGKELPEATVERKNIAPDAKITATTHEAPVSMPQNAINGIVDVSGKSRRNEWISLEGGGAALKLEWDTPKTIDRIRIYDSPANDRWVQEGYFVFSDGTMEWMYAAPSNSAKTPTEINFARKTVKWVKFTITHGIAEITTLTSTEPGQRLGISEIQVFEAK
jgi:hypothetical protein